MTNPPPAAPPAASFLESAQPVYAIFCCHSQGDIVQEEIAIVGIFLNEDVAKSARDELNTIFKLHPIRHFIRKTHVWPSSTSDDKKYVIEMLKKCAQVPPRDK